MNCLAGGSHVNKYPADGRSDLVDVPDETEAPLALPPAEDFPAFGDLDRAFPLGMMTVALVTSKNQVSVAMISQRADPFSQGILGKLNKRNQLESAQKATVTRIAFSNR